MTIAGFNSEQFAQNLAQQAMEVIPADITEQSKKFIVSIIYRYCVLAGDAIKEQNQNLTLDQASIICQFIGEWTFHKSIDLIRSNIPETSCEQVLQKIAFKVFEVAKESQLKKMEQEEAIAFVEEEVSIAYTEAIEELANSGVIDKALQNDALSQSNIDTIPVEEQQNDNSAQEQQKLFKLASLALLFKQFKPEKVARILKTLPKEDAEMITNFMNTPDLEQQLDIKTAGGYIKSFRKAFPGLNVQPQKDTFADKFHKLVNVNTQPIIFNAIKNERNNLRELIEQCSTKQNTVANKHISPHLSNVIYNYLTDKIET